MRIIAKSLRLPAPCSMPPQKKPRVSVRRHHAATRPRCTLPTLAPWPGRFEARVVVVFAALSCVLESPTMCSFTYICPSSGAITQNFPSLLRAQKPKREKSFHALLYVCVFAVLYVRSFQEPKSSRRLICAPTCPLHQINKKGGGGGGAFSKNKGSLARGHVSPDALIK